MNRFREKLGVIFRLQTGQLVTMTLCRSQFLLTALFLITYWLCHRENSNFRPFVFNKVAASF